MSVYSRIFVWCYVLTGLIIIAIGILWGHPRQNWLVTLATPFVIYYLV